VVRECLISRPWVAHVTPGWRATGRRRGKTEERRFSNTVPRKNRSGLQFGVRGVKYLGGKEHIPREEAGGRGSVLSGGRRERDTRKIQSI